MWALVRFATITAISLFSVSQTLLIQQRSLWKACFELRFLLVICRALAARPELSGVLLWRCQERQSTGTGLCLEQEAATGSVLLWLCQQLQTTA